MHSVGRRDHPTDHLFPAPLSVGHEMFFGSWIKVLNYNSIWSFLKAEKTKSAKFCTNVFQYLIMVITKKLLFVLELNSPVSMQPLDFVILPLDQELPGSQATSSCIKLNRLNSLRLLL